jgi:hypothetical protein
VEAGRSSTREDDVLDEDELGGEEVTEDELQVVDLGEEELTREKGADDLSPTAPPWPWCCLHVVDLDDMLDLRDELDRWRRSHADDV